MSHDLVQDSIRFEVEAHAPSNYCRMDPQTVSQVFSGVRRPQATCRTLCPLSFWDERFACEFVSFPFTRIAFTRGIQIVEELRTCIPEMK